VEPQGIRPGGGCPTVAQLEAQKLISSPSADPWGHPYRIDCGADDPVVLSDGPDGKPSTADDVRADAASCRR
jgi:hypothetical protein